MDYFKDFLYVNKNSFEKTIKSLRDNYLIIFTGVIYTIINLVIYTIINKIFIGPLVIISGFIIAIVSSSLISNYLNLLYNIINYNRFTLEDFKRGFTAFLWKIYGVFFIAYLGQLLLSLISNMLGFAAFILNFIILIGVFILFNPLPEIIYLKTYSPMDSITYSIEFIQENWLNWLIPNVILIGVLYIITGNLLIGIFNTHLNFNLLFSFKYIIIYLVGQVVFSFIMIFRGHLFKILSSSTRRKRMFMNKF